MVSVRCNAVVVIYFVISVGFDIMDFGYFVVSVLCDFIVVFYFVIVATCPFAGVRGEAHGCAFQRRKDAWSCHQRLFVENVGKTEGNRSK